MLCDIISYYDRLGPPSVLSMPTAEALLMGDGGTPKARPRRDLSMPSFPPFKVGVLFVLTNDQINK